MFIFSILFSPPKEYIKNLVDYGIAKIPVDSTHAPLIYSIGHLLNRAFLFFNFGQKKADNCRDNNELIVNKLCSEFFIKVQSDSQAKTLLHKLSQIIGESSQTASEKSNAHLDNLVEFIQVLRNLFAKNSFSSDYKYEEYMAVLYSVLNLTVSLLERMSEEHFMVLINVLQSLIIKILTLDLNFETKSLELQLEGDDDSSIDQMQMDDNLYVIFGYNIFSQSLVNIWSIVSQ